MSPKGVFIQLILIFSLLAYVSGSTTIDYTHQADVCLCKLEGALEPIIQLIDSCTESSCDSMCSSFAGGINFNSTCLYSQTNVDDTIDEDLEIIRSQISGIYDAFTALFGGKGTYIYKALEADLEKREDDSDFKYLKPTPTPTTAPKK
ncbi:hypothetical protein Gasu2_55810 [Galdieria sulphuraria]|nr:hypothetical protein Gasu2_55810 [Galdieria sulphuraria]